MTTWLHDERLQAARAIVLQSGARRVLDLGCDDGDLLTHLIEEPQIQCIVGVDLCPAALGRLRMRLDGLREAGAAKVDLIHGSMTEGAPALSGFDCVLLMETIEHVDPERLSLLERAVFADMRPKIVMITTPNVEFYALLGVPPHRYRHPGHCFEWDRARFRRWAPAISVLPLASRHGLGCSLQQSDKGACDG